MLNLCYNKKSMDNTVGRQIKKLHKLQKEILVGCLLGDGRLECRSKENTARLRIHHGDAQRSYVMWKYKMFQEITSCKPRKIIWEDKKRNLTCVSWYFHTLTLDEMKDLYQTFYKDGKKVLPSNILEILTPLALAVWTMDDGCNDSNTLIYNTHAFSYSEQKQLIEVLARKYGIKAGLNKDRNDYRIRIRKESMPRLITLIESYIIPSMKHKICHP